MIKRRFYKQEHGDKDAAYGSSSSSDSELDAEGSVDTEDEEEQDYDNNVVVESKKKDQTCSSSSGYESEDSSGNEANLDAAGLPTNDDDSDSEDKNYKQDVINTRVSADKHSDKKAITKDVSDCVLKSKSVFKCKLFPRIVCLTEETLKAHLKSKRHAQSEKLLKEGRLKMMLNSDGEIEEEEDGETHQERHAKTLALLQGKELYFAELDYKVGLGVEEQVLMRVPSRSSRHSSKEVINITQTLCSVYSNCPNFEIYKVLFSDKGTKCITQFVDICRLVYSSLSNFVCFVIGLIYRE